MSLLHHTIGNALKPVRTPAIIAHVCNDVGAFGAGFALAVARTYPKAKEDYKALDHYLLSDVQIVPIDDNLYIANMIAQHGLKTKGGVPPLRYESLEACLEHIQQWADAYHMTIHMPRVGARLAGGDWVAIEALIVKTAKVDTYIYTLENEKSLWPDCTYEEFA